MLVLSRKINETIIIGGNIRVTMTEIRGRQARLAIEAPPDVPILREELVERPRELPGADGSPVRPRMTSRDRAFSRDRHRSSR